MGSSFSFTCKKKKLSSILISPEAGLQRISSFIQRISSGFIFFPLGFGSFVLIQKNQKIKAAWKWLKSLLACLKEKNSPRGVRDIPGLRQFFFFNGNPTGFLNAISMMPRENPTTPTLKLQDFILFIPKKKSFSLIFVGLVLSCLILFHQPGFGQGQIDKKQLRSAEDLIRSGQRRQARRIYESLHNQFPDNPDLYRRLKDLYFQMQDYDNAFQLIQNRKQNHPNNFNLDVSLGRALFRMQRQQEAMDLWYGLLEKNPKNLAVYQSVARVMINERLLDEAIDVYLLFREKTGKQLIFTFNLVSLYLSRMNFGKATEEMILYLVKNPKHVSIVDNYLTRYPKTRRVMQEVTQQLHKAIDDHPGHLGLRELLVKTYVRAEEFDNAFRETKGIETQSKNPGQAIFQLGKEAFQAGASKQAERAYREILKKYPQYPALDQVMSGLAQSLEAQSKYAEAADTYHQTANRTKDPLLGAESLLRQGLIQRDQLFVINESIETFQTVQQKYPSMSQSKQATLEAAKSHIMLGDLEKAGKIYLQNLNYQKQKMDRFWIQNLVGHAEVLFLQLQFNEMQKVLEILSNDSLPEQVLQDPVLNDGLELQLLVKAHARKSVPQIQRFARADFLSRQRQFQPAIDTLDSLVEMGLAHPLSAYGLYKKGTIQILLKSYTSGISTLDTLLSRFPYSLLADRALEKTGWAFQEMGKKKEALNRYEILLANYPQSFLADAVRQQIRDLEGR